MGKVAFYKIEELLQKLKIKLIMPAFHLWLRLKLIRHKEKKMAS